MIFLNTNNRKIRIGPKEIDEEEEAKIFSHLDSDGFFRKDESDKSKDKTVDKSIERSLKWKVMIQDWDSYVTNKFKKV